jgi:hypothetical protein
VSAAANAQDIIVKRDASAEEIKAKVIEIGETNISYRKWANLEGPIYTIKKSEVFFIRYENGEKDVITPYNTQSQTAAATTSALTESVSDSTIPQQPSKRDKIVSVDITPSIGLAGMLFDGGENLSGFGVGGSVGLNYFFSDNSPWACVGVSLGYNYNNMMDKDSTYNLYLSTIDIDYYFGILGSKTSNLGGKFGFVMTVPISGKIGSDGGPKQDISDTLNALSGGFFAQSGWSWKHSDLGMRIQYNFTNTFTDTSSMLFRIGFYYSYRF